MTRNCTSCNATMIEGVTPASQGWCSAECDLPGISMAFATGDAEIFYNVHDCGGELIPAGHVRAFYNIPPVDLPPGTVVPYTIQGEYIARFDPNGRFVDVVAGEGGCKIVPYVTIMVNGVVSV